MRTQIERFMAILGLVLLLLGLEAGEVTAAQEIVIVVPNEFADVEGPSRIGSNSPEGPFRFQQIYAASQFGDLAQSAHLLTGFAWRPDEAVDGPKTVSLDMEIHLSTTVVEPNEMSWTYGDNVGLDETIVYSGPATLHTENIGPGDGPRAFDYVVKLQTPFYYDPSQGNLLMDLITYSGITSADYPNQDFVYDPSSSMDVVWGSPNSANAWAELGGMITQFTFLVPCEYDLAGDLNDDCRVDFCDLCLMLENWLVDCSADPGDPACVAK
jgi:hypothetical protein